MAERGKIFKDAPILAPNRSWFDMSYENTFSMNIGENVPAAIYECLPGDYIKAKSDSLTRFSPMLAPVMTSVNQFSYHFYVRMRDIWTNFDKFITNNDQKATWQQNTSFTAPTMPYFKPREIIYGSHRLGTDITEHNFETGTVDFINDPKTYRLVIQWYFDNTNDPSQRITYFVDKAIHPSYQLPAIGNTTPTDYAGYFIICFKPNPSEFDYDFDMGTNGIPNDFYRINPFGNGSLMDYLGVDLNPMFASQFDYYSKNIKTVHSTAGHNVYPLIINLDTLNIALEEQRSVLNSSVPLYIFDNQVPEGMDVNGGTDIAKFESFNISSLKDFFANHAITEVLVGYEPPSSSNYYFADVTAIGKYKYEGSGNIGTVSNPLDSITEDPLCALPLRAYRFIYDEYFRDQNYIAVNGLTDFTRDGDEFAGMSMSPTLSELNELVDYLSTTRKAWEHDPYTTALPGPQRGDPVHFLPSRADIKVSTSGTGHNSSGYVLLGMTANSDGKANQALLTTESGNNLYDATIQADLSAATIESFRWANSMQKYLEKKARTGGRYFEYLLGIWNKSVDDSKLNRPIYLSGDRTPIQVSEVLQTSATDVSSRQALGDMAGRAIALGNDDFIEYEAPDYGYFIEITTVVPRVAYQSGVSPIFCKENYLDFPLPDFAQLGEEYVKLKDLYYQADSSKDNKAFGYQSRYWQYKYRRSEIHGEMKDSLDFWHFGRKFDSEPVNGKLFIECHPDYRQFAVISKGFAHVYCQMWHDVQMNRALPEYGVPVL